MRTQLNANGLPNTPLTGTVRRDGLTDPIRDAGGEKQITGLLKSIELRTVKLSHSWHEIIKVPCLNCEQTCYTLVT